MSRRWLLFVLVAAATVGFPVPYVFRNWWRYIPETILLLVTFRVAFGRHWRDRSGLRGDGALSLGLFGLVTAAAFVLVPKMTASLGFTPVDGSGYFLRPVFSAFHALNEEWAFRALPLLALPWSRKHPREASVIAATVFAGAHAVFYPVAFGGPIGPTALLSLFLLAIGLNTWCTARRSIGICWAIHAGVNTALFGLHDYADASGRRITEPQFFDAALSHPAMVTATALLALSGALAYRFSRATMSA